MSPGVRDTFVFFLLFVFNGCIFICFAEKLATPSSIVPGTVTNNVQFNNGQGSSATGANPGNVRNANGSASTVKGKSAIDLNEVRYGNVAVSCDPWCRNGRTKLVRWWRRWRHGFVPWATPDHGIFAPNFPSGMLAGGGERAVRQSSPR